MPVYKSKTPTKDGRAWEFVVSYKNLQGDYVQKKRGKYATKKEAQEEEAKFLMSYKDLSSSNMTLKDVYFEYYNFRKSRVKARTLETNDDRVRLHILPYLGNKKISKITSKEIIEWQDIINNLKMQNGEQYSINYKKSIYVSLSSIFKHALLFFGVYNNPLKIVGNFKNTEELKKEMQFFTIDEFNKFIKEEQDLIYRVFFYLLYYTGLRKGEAKALNWNDINIDKGSLKVNKTLTSKVKDVPWVITPPKTKSAVREVLMPDILVNELKELYEYYSKYDNFENEWFVFGGVEPLADSNIDNHKNNNCKKIGKTIRIHDFRHSHVTLCIQLGADIVYISKRLGHKDISETLNTYSHLFPSKQAEIIDKMNKILT